MHNERVVDGHRPSAISAAIKSELSVCASGSPPVRTTIGQSPPSSRTCATNSAGEANERNE